MLPSGILVPLYPPLGRYSLQASSYIACGGVGGVIGGAGKIFFLLPKVCKILTYFPDFMPTAPTRIKHLPRVSGRLTYSDKF